MTRIKSDDEDKILKDGERVRISMTMRDSLRSQDAKPQFTDGRTTDPTALNRPGFRVQVVNDRRAVRDAYADYETDLVNAFRGEERFSSTYTHDPAQNARRSDSLTTLNQHRQTMDRLYRERDAEMADAWRNQ
jgi:hypothetical protein